MGRRKNIIVALVLGQVMCMTVFIMGCLMKIHMALYGRISNVHIGYAADSINVIVVPVFCALTLMLVCGMSVYIIYNGRHIFRREAKVHQLKEQLEAVKSLTEQLQDEYMNRAKTDKARSRFMSRMSHDLRTPMNAIMGYSALMERAARHPEKVKHYSRRIFVAGQTLLELINDALDMSCIESGNLKLVEHEFSIKSVFEEVKTAIKPQADAKNLTFNTYITNTSNRDLIIGDKQRFCQVVRNLLSNAIKYTDDGGVVELIVNIIETGQNELQIIYQVKDTGCGMHEDFIKRVFKPFQREDNEMNTSAPGTGLGLCIAKSFVELMKGSISVESKPGYGTLVTVILPLKPVVKDNSDYHITQHCSNELKGMRFLAAEDNASNAEILKEILNMMGAECTLTENGQEVTEMFRKSAPGTYDAVLMDIQMPVMNGYQAASQIRSCGHPDAEDIVIIAMTADAFEQDVQKAFVSGMNAHVAKPLNISSFIGTIKTLGLN